MPSVPGFVPSTHGLPFANSWPNGMPVLEVPTPFGTVPLGNARNGVCGGMVYTVIDCFTYNEPPPQEPTLPVFRYLVRRLFESWDLPLGGLRYYTWQTRSDESRFVSGVRVRAGVSYLTIMEEWPKIRAVLDAGMLAPLGIVNVHSWDFRQIGRNHQVLAYGYELSDTAVTLLIYDPNYPCDDGLSLRLELGEPDRGRRVCHSFEGSTCRGFFLTEYRKPRLPPRFAERT